MPLRTTNALGNISVTDKVVATVARRHALDCYGVVDIVPIKFSDVIEDLFSRNEQSRGVKITARGDKVQIELFVILKFGLSISAVSASLRDAVKYGVEHFTGMIVKSVVVHVTGVKI